MVKRYWKFQGCRGILGKFKGKRLCRYKISTVKELENILEFVSLRHAKEEGYKDIGNFKDIGVFWGKTKERD